MENIYIIGIKAGDFISFNKIMSSELKKFEIKCMDNAYDIIFILDINEFKNGLCSLI